MIDVVNPINLSHPLNRDIDFWAMALPGMRASTGIVPEHIRRQHGTVKVMANPVPPQGVVPSWHHTPGQSSNQLQRDIPYMGFDGAGQYVQFDSPARSRDGSFTAAVTFYSANLSSYSAAACGRRTATGSPDAAWTLQNRIGAGFSLVIKEATGPYTILSHGFYGAAGISYWMLTVGYDAATLRTTTYLRGDIGRSYQSATIASARDPHSAILMAAGEYNGGLGDYGVQSIGSLRLWSRALSEQELDAVYHDAANNYNETINRQRGNRWAQSVIVPTIRRTQFNINQAVKAASTY